jgi:Leucine-rich repeat (LRR) protein
LPIFLLFVFDTESNGVFESLKIKCQVKSGIAKCDNVKVINSSQPELILIPKSQPGDVKELVLEQNISVDSLKSFRFELFNAFSNLNSLSTINYAIPSITFDNSLTCKRLEKISVAGAGLKTFKSDQNLQLKLLSFRNNKISVIDKNVFKGLQQLITLDLFGNNIQKIDSDAFIHLKSLRVLKLGRNPLNNPGLAFYQAIPSTVNTLHLDETPISEIPKGAFKSLPRLSYLFMVNGKLKSFVASELGTKSLKTLRLVSNQITKLSTSGCKNLETLNVDQNNLTRLSYDMFNSNINELTFSKNKITSIEKKIIEGMKRLLKTSDYSLNPCVRPGPTPTKDKLMENLEDCFNNFKP